jgi:carboxyl-terminal processing protease
MTVAMRVAGAAVALSVLAACGGGGGGGGETASSGGSFTPGVFQPSSSFEAQCVSPRSGTNPATQAPFPDRQGSVTSENNFLRSWTNELYLWYREVPDTNPANVATLDYFDTLKTPAKTASGQDKDKFHFTFDSADWFALSQSGVEASYGVQWLLLAPSPPRRIVVAYTQPNSPATAAAVNLTRGVEVLVADGVDVINAGTQAAVDTLNAAFFPADPGETHTFTIRELSGATRNITMTSANVTSTPVQNVSVLPTASGPIGYFVFNDHIATAEPALINAINTLKAANITDLVLDIRYNGGGFLDIASELGYMIAGNATTGRTFERLMFNDKHPSTNPVTRQPLSPTPFHTTTKILSPTGQALPTLNLPRVYVLTSASTCSASESIMNSLRGVDVAVYQIGSTTCGKPYGFYPKDNCGTTYFSIQFQGVNAKDFGEYPDGFSPANTAGTRGELLPGCSVADDFTKALGDPTEGRLAAALAFRASNNLTCPAASGFAPGASMKPGQPLTAADGVMPRSPLRENRILTDM